MTVNHIIQFIVVSASLRTREELLLELEKLLNAYRFEYYGIVRTPRPDEEPIPQVMAERWPDKWSQLYLNKKFGLIDPTVRYLSQAQRPYRWSDTLSAFKDDPQYKRMQRMMGDAQKFGLEDGYVFPLYGRGGLLGNMTVSGHAVDLSPLDLTMLDAAVRSAFWRLVELSGHADLFSPVEKVEVRLTKREMEILHYLGEGMTSNEMSKLLEISNHTVDWYVNELQDKLTARNRQHMVALAFRLGLIR
ncbi:LuxR family transcriptional regulator [Allorhizobium sp. BGMRC 0089]|uniref:LuxR family transcriptional regulator n=1 Tax=Allorhizobium sonneratiae TaxID=2934936 RepID=UPI002033C2AD|nr:LuxR family transcriptional regulator [Allorhizobium sonneratiae]MCM2293311.1 LuxR family transcriptional regulator [Allorhizobium sonneratiae]